MSRLPTGPEDWWYYTGGLLGSVVVWQTVFGVAVTMVALLLASASGLRAGVVGPER